MTSNRTARSKGAPTTRRRSRRTERVPKEHDVVDIWWATDRTYYRGRLTDQKAETAFKILYDDGETEDLDLVNEYWKFADDDRPPPPDSEKVVDVVLDGSHQQSRTQSKPHHTPKKQKPRSLRQTTARTRARETSDDERDLDYVEEQLTPDSTSKQKRAKSDSEKPKKRPKRNLARRQSTTSDKTSSASRPPQKTSSESRHPPQPRVDQPDSTSHLSPLDHTLRNEISQGHPESASSRQKNVAPAHTDSKHTSISREETNAESKNKNDTQIVDITPSSLPAPNTPPFHLETQLSKSQIMPTSPKAKTPASEIVQPRTTVNSVSHLPTTTPSTGNQRLVDTVATSQQIKIVQHTHIANQRDLATIQAEPSLLPIDRQALPCSSDPIAPSRQTVINSDAPTSFAQYKKASSVAVPPTAGSTPGGPTSGNSLGEEMVIGIPPEEGTSPPSVPVKVALRPKNSHGNASGSGVSNPNRTGGETSTDHSGVADCMNETEENKADTVRKRNREDGDIIHNLTGADVNNEARPKRSKTTGTVEGIKAPSSQPDKASPLTHFPELDPTLSTLVNQALGPTERHLHSLAEGLHRLTSNETAQQKVNEAITGTMQRLEQDFRKELQSIRKELSSAEADRREKQEEIVKLLREIRDCYIIAPSSQTGGEPAVGLAAHRRGAPNGYSTRVPNYQRSAAAPGVSSGLPQTSQRRDPGESVLQVRAPVRTPARTPIPAPAPRDHVELPGTINSDDDVNVSPRRVAAPLSDAAQGPVDMNASKNSQLSSSQKSRITDVVARQITVWLLETNHEFDVNDGMSLEEWARVRSACALEGVANRLSHFDDYTQAYQTLSTSLGNEAVEMSWFTKPEDRANLMRARRNYDTWDPPPSNSEWESECLLLTEVANSFHRAVEKYKWHNEDDLTAAVIITNNAAASYGTEGAGTTREPSGGGNHVAISQAHRTSHSGQHNGRQFTRTSR